MHENKTIEFTNEIAINKTLFFWVVCLQFFLRFRYCWEKFLSSHCYTSCKIFPSFYSWKRRKKTWIMKMQEIHEFMILWNRSSNNAIAIINWNQTWSSWLIFVDFQSFQIKFRFLVNRGRLHFLHFQHTFLCCSYPTCKELNMLALWYL